MKVVASELERCELERCERKRCERELCLAELVDTTNRNFFRASSVGRVA